MWQRDKAFAARAEAGSAWALQTILERIHAGDLDQARADAVSLEPFWHQVDPALLALALRCATELQDAAAARVVMAPFRAEMLTAEHAPLVADLARAYGDPWLLDLIAGWKPAMRYPSADQGAWVAEQLLPLSRALREHDADPIADGVVQHAWGGLASRVDSWVKYEHPDQRRTQLDRLGPQLAHVLAAASDELGTSIAEALQTSGEHADELLVPVLREHQPPQTPALLALADDCRRRLLRHLDRPVRAEGDWSIPWAGCGCDLCARLAEFLGSPSERALEWPLAQARRQHIHQKIDIAGLPVRHTTRRQGRPYMLVLTKTDDLFHREEDVRRRARANLAWLEQEFKPVGAAHARARSASSPVHHASRHTTPQQGEV